jgi:hypothetical protein
MINFLLTILFLGFIVWFFSMIKMKHYLTDHRREIPWGGIYLFALVTEYWEISKKSNGKRGVWIDVFFLSFMACIVSVIILMIWS